MDSHTRATKDSLRTYLSNHPNWAEVSQDAFECIIEHPDVPSGILLQEQGVVLNFTKTASSFWRLMADRSRFCSYEHLYFKDPESALHPGSLMMIISQELIPSEASRSDLRPLLP